MAAVTTFEMTPNNERAILATAEGLDCASRQLRLKALLTPDAARTPLDERVEKMRATFPSVQRALVRQSNLVELSGGKPFPVDDLIAFAKEAYAEMYASEPFDPDADAFFDEIHQALLRDLNVHGKLKFDAPFDGYGSTNDDEFETTAMFNNDFAHADTQTGFIGTPSSEMQRVNAIRFRRWEFLLSTIFIVIFLADWYFKRFAASIQMLHLFTRVGKDLILRKLVSSLGFVGGHIISWASDLLIDKTSREAHNATQTFIADQADRDPLTQAVCRVVGMGVVAFILYKLFNRAFGPSQAPETDDDRKFKAPIGDFMAAFDSAVF